MAALVAKLRNVAGVVGCALAVAACASDTSYQEQALRASEGGDLRSATSLAQKEVEKYSAPDQCSSTTNYNCGTLALALSSLAEYQILSGNKAAGERSFDRAKGALQLVPKDNKPSATGMVYRDVSEAFWKAGDKRRAIAVFKEGTSRGADEWLYTSSAAKAVAQDEGRIPVAGTPIAPAAPGAPVPLGPVSATPVATPASATEADTMVKPTMVNDPAINDPMRSLPPSSAAPVAPPSSQPAPASPLTPSPLGPTPTPLQRSRY